VWVAHLDGDVMAQSTWMCACETQMVRNSLVQSVGDVVTQSLCIWWLSLHGWCVSVGLACSNGFLYECGSSEVE
jgi:hypothetical protein